jgi:hypothetical protein
MLLETLNKDQSETESKSGTIEEEKVTVEEKKVVDRKEDQGGESKGKTQCYCAINEKELNKVELAYFKRPMNTVILSDK